MYDDDSNFKEQFSCLEMSLLINNGDTRSFQLDLMVLLDTDLLRCDHITTRVCL